MNFFCDNIFRMNENEEISVRYSTHTYKLNNFFLRTTHFFTIPGESVSPPQARIRPA